MKKIISLIYSILLAVACYGQSAPVRTEVHTYNIVDGRIVIPLIMNGVEGRFILDLAGRTAILPEFQKKIDLADIVDVTHFDFPETRSVKTAKKGSIAVMSFGNSVYSNGASALILEGDPAQYLRGIGVDGVVGSAFFKNVVLTIDKRGGRLFTSVPYRPSFMRLTERVDAEVSLMGVVEFDINIGTKATRVVLDTWQTALLVLNKDREIAVKKSDGSQVSIASNSYAAPVVGTSSFTVPSIGLVHVNIEKPVVSVDFSLTKPVVGLALLDHGLISIDFARGKIYFQDYKGTVVSGGEKAKLTQIEPGKLNAITKDDFVAYVYDYRLNKDFKFKGDKPVVIDFWASWCGPCMKMMPTMEKLAEKYKDEIVFYKVNADVEKELTARFNITALPTMYLIAPGKNPIIEVGADEAKIMEVIEKNLLGQ